jgi:pilus assembly protein CpaB
MATTTPLIRAANVRSPLVLLLLAALMAAAVAWLAYHYLQKKEEAIKAEVTARERRGAAVTVQVAVPRTDAPAGTPLDTRMFVARPVEEDLIYPDTVLAKDFEALRGQTLARPLQRGRPLRMSDVVAPPVHDVAGVLPTGERALTIDIDNLNSIAQTLRPNHHVDLFLLHKAAHAGGADAQEAGEATLYMQDLVVLATGTDFRDVAHAHDGAGAMQVNPGEVEGKDRGYDTVTLLVTPAQAARVLLGQKLGAYRVVLRGAQDRAPVRMASLRGADLLPGPGPDPSHATRGRDAGIEFIVGGRSGNLVSELPTLPSQAALRNLQAGLAALARPAAAPPAAAVTTTATATAAAPATPPQGADPNRQSITISMPVPPASRPFSANGKNQ